MNLGSKIKIYFEKLRNCIFLIALVSLCELRELACTREQCLRDYMHAQISIKPSTEK